MQKDECNCQKCSVAFRIEGEFAVEVNVSFKSASKWQVGRDSSQKSVFSVQGLEAKRTLAIKYLGLANLDKIKLREAKMKKKRNKKDTKYSFETSSHLETIIIQLILKSDPTIQYPFPPSKLAGSDLSTCITGGMDSNNTNARDARFRRKSSTTKGHFTRRTTILPEIDRSSEAVSLTACRGGTATFDMLSAAAAQKIFIACFFLRGESKPGGGEFARPIIILVLPSQKISMG
ncbi:hypothetical protein CEXT_21651 [Caerostris extrusa]|uniref:Uncharacterized protein n=1 Tax=Caerostris extrusa TaxID=172846 RepID=A0AAV4MBM2_CAEEX|nr:hypothetical protein CEXT_21651 [Caerostris extrusa]